MPNLSHVNLDHADLRHSDLTFSDLRISSLSFANLSFARLCGADLGRARLWSTDLRNVLIGNTHLDRTVFASVVLADFALKETIALEKTFHPLPSIVDRSTIQNLQGQITADIETFLNGCGYTRWEIEIMRLHDPASTPGQISDHLTTKVFPFRTRGAIYLGGVFLSYAHKDQRFVDKLYNALTRSDIEVYLDRHDFTAGSLEKNISRAIRINDQVVVVLSKHSLASEWVWLEISSALEKEREIGKDVLFPICIDDECWKEQRNKERLMNYVKERVILDFTDKSTFESNLQKLITGMKVNR